MSSLPADRNAPFAGWTPELMEHASSAHQAEQEAIDRICHEAYAEGRKDERESLQCDVQKALELMRSLLLGRGELPSSDVINATVTDAINVLRRWVKS